MKFLITIIVCLGATGVLTTKGQNYRQDISQDDYPWFIKNFAFGGTTNGICACVRFDSSQSNICIGVLATSPAPVQLWIAPPKFDRAEYYLIDSAQKVVPYLPTYHLSDGNYKTIDDVPKNAHNVHIGTMFGPPFSTPYEQANLNDIFDIKHGGDYKLIIRARIMKIQRDSRLTIMEFPPVSLMLHIH